MALLSFKERFADLVEKGKKCQTIRNERKIAIKPFEQLYLYFGARTSWCRKLGEGQCTRVHRITINSDSVLIHDMLPIRYTEQKDLDKFARKDGFSSWTQMRKWWVLTHGVDCFPFNGIIIYWNLLSKINWLKPSSRKAKFLRKISKGQF